jgi:hypothetical protein
MPQANPDDAQTPTATPPAPNRYGFKVDNPWSENGKAQVLLWIKQRAMMISYRATLGDMTPCECFLTDIYGNTKIIDHTRDYTIGDLYAPSGALL